MALRKQISVAFAVALTVSPATAAVMDSSSTGLAAPGVTIGFEEVALATGTNVTNQFAGLGVTFTPGVTYFTNVSPRPNFSGPAVIDFFGAEVSIKFTQSVTEMAAAMTANSGGATFTSLLNGVIVEMFSSSLDLSQNNFYGFTNSLFDEVKINPTGSTSVAADNLSFTVAVPLPASLPLLIGALGGVFALRRRRART